MVPPLSKVSGAAVASEAHHCRNCQHETAATAALAHGDTCYAREALRSPDCCSVAWLCVHRLFTRSGLRTFLLTVNRDTRVFIVSCLFRGCLFHTWPSSTMLGRLPQAASTKGILHRAVAGAVIDRVDHHLRAGACVGIRVQTHAFLPTRPGACKFVGSAAHSPGVPSQRSMHGPRSPALRGSRRRVYLRLLMSGGEKQVRRR